MRALLIHPTLTYPEADVEALRSSMMPLQGVNTLAAALRTSGTEAHVLDPFFYYLARRGPAESFAGMAERLVRDQEPELICVSVVSHLRAAAEELVRCVKAARPDALVVVGGVHVTDGSDLALRQFKGVADMVIAGPGETPLAILARSAKQRSTLLRLPGLLWRTPGALPTWAAHAEAVPSAPIPPADAGPLPNYDQYEERIEGGVIPRAILSTTRGCPFACRFCSAASVRGNGLWAMSPEKVLEHLRHLKERYGVREISFHDETFFSDSERAIAIFALMKGQALVFDDIYLHTTVASLDRPVLRAYRQAGGRRLFGGLESGSARIRHEMRKPFAHRLTNAEILERARLCQEEGIEIGVFVIVGWPGETQIDRDETRRLLEQLRPGDLQTSVLKIYPGTEIYARALREGRMREEDWMDLTHPYFTYATGEDLIAARAFARELEGRFQTHRIRKPFESQGDHYGDVQEKEPRTPAPAASPIAVHRRRLPGHVLARRRAADTPTS